jgi:hypothetical protein
MSTDGESGQELRNLELQDLVTFDLATDDSKREYEVVSLVEDEGTKYGILCAEITCEGCQGTGKRDGSTCDVCEGEGTDRQFIVTDIHGDLVKDQDLAQEILDDFFILLEEAGDKGGAE